MAELSTIILKQVQDLIGSTHLDFEGYDHVFTKSPIFLRILCIYYDYYLIIMIRYRYIISYDISYYIAISLIDFDLIRFNEILGLSLGLPI